MDRIETRPLSAASVDRLDRLFRRYHATLLALATTLVRDRDHAAAEDVASETWARAAASIHQLQADDDHACGWLRTILVRAATDYYRPRRASEEPRDWTDDAVARALPASPAADTAALAPADLTPQQAAVLRLKAQGMSDRRIARRLRSFALAG